MKFIKYRFYIVVGVFFVLGSLLLLRAFSVQVLPNKKLKSLYERQFRRVVTLQPSRGIIFDRNQKELASSITAYSLFADPSLIEDSHGTALKLSKVLKKNSRNIKKTISNKSKRFVWIERKLSEDIKNKISKLKIQGLGFVEESQRIYPNQNLLSHTLGFVGREGQGLEGIENRFNDTLSGDQKKFLIQKDARGRPLVVNGRLFNDQPDGLNIHLTIDSEIQYVLEQELRQSVLENNADSAVGIIIEADTNEIVAMASVPDFDPNRALRYSGEARKNRAILEPFEPGSTLKPFVVAGALREGKLKPNTKFYGEKGSLKVADRVIKESSHTHKFEWLTVSEILAKSSNIGMVKIAFQLGAKKTRDILMEFGFGMKTGVPLGGDSRGIVPDMPWRDVRLANISFGQGIASTALQMANAYAALANGGVLKEPLLVKSIVDPQTGEREDFKPKVIRRVLSEAQTQTLLLMLTGVTNRDGTATNARIAGFPVAGKTGTAQKVDPIKGGYLKKSYIASFAGVLPVHQPKYAIYIAVDNPKNNKYYGSEVAVPIFVRVGEYALRKSGISPILLSQENLIHKTKAKQQKSIEKLIKKMPDQDSSSVHQQFLNISVREAIQKSKSLNIPIRIYGSGKSYSVETDGSSETPKNVRVYFK